MDLLAASAPTEVFDLLVSVLGLSKAVYDTARVLYSVVSPATFSSFPAYALVAACVYIAGRWCGQPQPFLLVTMVLGSKGHHYAAIHAAFCTINISLKKAEHAMVCRPGCSEPYFQVLWSASGDPYVVHRHVASATPDTGLTAYSSTASPAASPVMGRTREAGV